MSDDFWEKLGVTHMPRKSNYTDQKIHMRGNDRPYCAARIGSFYQPILIADDWKNVTCKTCINLKSIRDKREEES